MSAEEIHVDGGFRARITSKVIRSYPFSRGKDRLFLVLRSLLSIPRFVVSNISDDLELELDLDDYLQRWMFCHRLVDDVDYARMSEFLQEGDHFIDVGANIGIVSLLAAVAVGNTGRVFAIEALPSTREKLQENISLNGVNNITVLPFAILNENKQVPFFASVDGNIGGSSLSEAGIKDKPIVVEGRTLDSLITDGQIDRCDVMKITSKGPKCSLSKECRRCFQSSNQGP